MFVGTVSYRTEPPETRWEGGRVTGGREREVVRLVKDHLPHLVVEAVGQAADSALLNWSLGSRIDIRGFHPDAHNPPDVEVVIGINRGDSNELYDARDAIRMYLARTLLSWFERNCQGDSRVVRSFIVNIHLGGHMCGMRLHVDSHRVLTAWGGRVDFAPDTVITPL
jgi:hypothetical protein